MGRLAALGVDPTPLLTLPAWLEPVWEGVAEKAEEYRLMWSELDGTATINALSEAMG